MSRFEPIYSPRARSTNIELIRAVRGAQNQEEFEAADARIAAEMHPSLLAELDWMEMCTPPEGRPECAEFLDGLFMHHLPLILSQRKSELLLEDDEFALEVAENVDFYRFLLEQRPDAQDALGADLWSRITEVAAQAESWAPQVAERIQTTAELQVEHLMGPLLDRRWLWLLVHTAMDNCLAAGMDHVSSRPRTKYFLRQIGGQFPAIAGGGLESAEDLTAFTAELRALADEADRCGVLRFSTLVRGIADACEGLDLAAIEGFCGERAGGFGACGTCAMMFGGTAIVSLDCYSPAVLASGDGLVCLPLSFNLTACPFCGAPQRADLPSLFFSSPRSQVFYNVPTAGQATPADAVAAHRETLLAMRNAYLGQVDPKFAKEFVAAKEVQTHTTADWLMAMQVGSTQSASDYCVVQSERGAGLLLDPGSGALIGLSRTELSARLQNGQPQLAAEHPLASGPGKTAMDALSEGNLDYACGALGALMQSQPHAGVVARVLASVCLTLGDREAAARALGVNG